MTNQYQQHRLEAGLERHAGRLPVLGNRSQPSANEFREAAVGNDHLDGAVTLQGCSSNSLSNLPLCLHMCVCHTTQ